MDVRRRPGQRGLVGGADALLGERVVADNFSLRFEAGASLDMVADAVRGLSDVDPRGIVPAVPEDALEGLKFSECLPVEVATETVQARLMDAEGVAGVVRRIDEDRVCNLMAGCSCRPTSPAP